jgi:hypothetical protein
MVNLPEAFRKLYANHPDVFAERAGGSAVAQLISPNGKPLELGEQRGGLWLPHLKTANHYGLFVGLPHMREQLIVQQEVPATQPDGNKALMVEMAVKSVYQPGKEEPVQTVPLYDGLLDLHLAHLADRALNPRPQASRGIQCHRQRLAGSRRHQTRMHLI